MTDDSTRMKQNPFRVKLINIQREYNMKTSTIVNANTIITSKFNTALTTVVNNSVEANKAMQIMTEVMNNFGRFEYFIAGGVYRDNLLGVEISDVDIFLVNMERDEFNSIVSGVSSSLNIPKEYEGRDDYGDDTASVRVGNINLIAKPQLSSPQQVLEEFSASCSKVGKWVDGFTGDETILYCDKGMKDLLLRNTVEFFYDYESYPGLRKYISKISSKDWAKGYKFTCKMSSFTSEITVKSTLELTLVNEMHVTGIAFEDLGAFASDYELRVRGIEIGDYLDSLGTNAKYIGPNQYGTWAEVLSKGLLEMPFVDGVILLSEYGLISDIKLVPDFELNLHCHTYEDIINASVGVWNLSQVKAYEARKEHLGWGCLYDKNLLNKFQVKELLDEGKLRLALNSSTSLEVFLNTIGLGNKVIGSPDDSGFFGGYGYTMSSFHARNILKDLKIKGKLIKPCHSYSELVSAAVWSTVLGSEYIHLRSYYLSHEMLAKNYPHGAIPVKYHAQIAKSASLCDWVFEKKIQISWDKKSAKACVLATLEGMYPGIDPNEVFLNPNIREVLEYTGVNPSKNVAHNFPAIELSVGSVSMELLPKNDPINLYIGEFTSCCQKLGSVGEKVCTDGWNDKYSVNYVFKSATSGKIIAHAWVWEDIEGNYVIDSLEGRAHADISDISSLVFSFAKECKKTLGNSVRISKTGYGMTRDVISKLNLSEQTVCLDSSTEYGYMDASIGQDLYVVA